MIRLFLRPFERRWVMDRGSHMPEWIARRFGWAKEWLYVEGCPILFVPSDGPDNDWGHTAQVKTPNGIVTAKQGDTIMIRFGKLYVEAK